MNIRSHAVICAAVFLAVVQAYGEGRTNSIDRATLKSRTHATWEGTYTFSEESVIEIEGLKDLHILIYRCVGHEGTLVDFAAVNTDGGLRILHEAETHVKGVTPVLEGIDVLVGSSEAEVIVRWRHPGQGGERSVEKYRCSEGRMRRVSSSSYIIKGRTKRWMNDESSKRSTPAKFAPLPRSGVATNEAAS